LLLDLRQNVVVGHAIAPQAVKIAAQGLAKATGSSAVASLVRK